MGSYGIEEALGLAGDQVSPGASIRGWVRELYGAGLPLNNHSNVYETARVIKSGPGYLIGFTVYNSNASSQFIQLFDLAVLPASAAIPCFVISVATVTDREIYFGVPGRAFQLGIVIANSSTGPTYTAGGVDCFYDAQYV